MTLLPSKKRVQWKTIQVPAQLYAVLEEFVDDNAQGYTSRNAAAAEAIRDFIRRNKPELFGLRRI